jgi:hypothetical protein
MRTPGKAAWDGYRKWNRISRITSPIFVVCVVFSDRTPILPILGFLCFVASAPAGSFRCPECGEFFFYKFGSFNWNPFPQKCLHCGLPKWEEPRPKAPKVEVHPIPRNKDPAPDPLIAERSRLAKFLTLVLRDDPKSIGLRVDENGWTNVDELLNRSQRNGIKLTHEKLADVLAVSSTHRFEWDKKGNRIRNFINMSATAD